jgi:DNA-binding NarL/FixJ family response regulator
MLAKKEHAETLQPTDKSDINEIKIVVVSNPEIYTDGLIRLLSDNENHKVQTCLKPGHDCVKKFSKFESDLLLIQQSVIEACHTPSSEPCFDKFKRNNPDVRIVVFGNNLSDAFTRSMIRDGAHGFIDGAMTVESLNQAIEEVYRGGYWINRNILGELINDALEVQEIMEHQVKDNIENLQYKLTKREADVFGLVMEGMTTKDIADKMCLSEQGVKMHLGRLFKKFEVKNRAQLIVQAFLKVCPVNNVILLLRKAADKRRMAKGGKAVIRDPLKGSTGAA